jgi:hypothetical protein
MERSRFDVAAYLYLLARDTRLRLQVCSRQAKQGLVPHIRTPRAWVPRRGRLLRAGSRPEPWHASLCWIRSGPTWQISTR